MNVKIRSYIFAYASGCRKRHQHHRYKNEIVEFIVQLEIRVKERWYPAIRYDTAHGFAHCDIIHWNGKTEKTIMPTLNYRQALTYADEDLNENWKIYHDLFLKGVPDEER